MLRKIFARGAAAIRRASGVRPRVESRNVLGHALDVVEDTLRLTTDYDDAWFLACAVRAQTIFDVGANRGYMALLALLCPEVRQVVLFEPNPDALMVASENLIRNKLSARARFVCAFVSAGSGDTARLWTVGSGAAGSVYASHAATASRGGHSIDVPTATLDEVSEAYGVVPELVKVDVEGAESQVLEGARTLASHNRSRFLVEVHSNPDLTITANTAAILTWCEGRDYAAWYLARHARLTDPEQVRDRGRCHVLLQPSAWPYPPWLSGIQQSAALPEILPVPRAEG